jgi:hypothetical protein
MAIKRGCSDRWRRFRSAGTRSRFLQPVTRHRCKGSPGESRRAKAATSRRTPKDRPCTRVPPRSFPDVVPRRRAKYAHIRACFEKEDPREYDVDTPYGKKIPLRNRRLTSGPSAARGIPPPRERKAVAAATSSHRRDNPPAPSRKFSISSPTISACCAARRGDRLTPHAPTVHRRALAISGCGSPMVRFESDLASNPPMPPHRRDPDESGQAARGMFPCRTQGRPHALRLPGLTSGNPSDSFVIRASAGPYL